MRILLARNWWSLVVRVIVAILFGIVTFFWPAITLLTLVLLFGVFALTEGIVDLVGAVRAAEARERWGVLVLEGLVGIAAGVVTLGWPAITAVALVYVVAIWAIFTGVLELAAAIRLRKAISGEWLMALAGIASVVFGILLMASPLIGAVVLALWVGAYAFIFGVLLIALGLRLRSWRQIAPHGPTIMAPAH